MKDTFISKIIDSLKIKVCILSKTIHLQRRNDYFNTICTAILVCK